MKSKPIFTSLLMGAFALSLYADSPITTAEAAKKLKAGAVLVDVRTKEEFAGQCVSGATNLPLDTIRTSITNVIPEKSTVVLLHCRSGRRSGLAEKELRSLGYTNSYNIGSFEQAEAAVKARRN